MVSKDEESFKSLSDLIDLQGSLEDLLKCKYRNMSQPVEPVILRRDHVVSVLNRFIAGEVQAGQVGAWAEKIHSQEWLDYEPESVDDLTQFLVEVSTPELFGDLTEDRARQWLDRLLSI